MQIRKRVAWTILCMWIIGMITNIMPVAFAVEETEDPDKKFLLEMKRQAEEGKIAGCPFPLGTHMDAFIERWGQPDSRDVEDKRIRLLYSTQGIEAFFDKDSGEAVCIVYPGFEKKNIKWTQVSNTWGEAYASLPIMVLMCKVYQMGDYTLLLIGGHDEEVGSVFSVTITSEVRDLVNQSLNL